MTFKVLFYFSGSYSLCYVVSFSTQLLNVELPQGSILGLLLFLLCSISLYCLIHIHNCSYFLLRDNLWIQNLLSELQMHISNCLPGHFFFYISKVCQIQYIHNQTSDLWFQMWTLIQWHSPQLGKRNCHKDCNFQTYLKKSHFIIDI